MFIFCSAALLHYVQLITVIVCLLKCWFTSIEIENTTDVYDSRKGFVVKAPIEI